MFHRLNRTYYSLSAIEKISSEYSASEFLLLARLLCGEISAEADEYPEELLEDDEGVVPNRFARDPGIDDESWEWLQARVGGPYTRLIADKGIFTSFEFDRKVPLMFTLDVMCTYLSGYFNRNDKVRRFLEDKNSIFPERQEVFDALNFAAKYIISLGLPEGAMWWNKANFFTLICEVVRSKDIQAMPPSDVAEKLDQFAKNVPADYALAAREAVGRKGQREMRGKTIRTLLIEGS